MVINEMKTLYLDAERGLCVINGEDLSGSITKLSIEYDDREWAVEVTLNKIYASTAPTKD